MAIEHLSKWNFSVEFRLYEAAALIVGIDPSEIYTSPGLSRDNTGDYEYHKHPQIKPAVDRMKRDFLSACDYFLAMREGNWSPSSAEQILIPESILRRREMEILPLRVEYGDYFTNFLLKENLYKWESSEDRRYETAIFTRTELSRWLSANCLKSVYRFDLELAKAVAPVEDDKVAGARWPAHETKNLTALRLAAVRFWTNYNPNDSTTAPKNEAVSEWLVNEHGLSSTLAAAMATILRADELKTGPRPK